MTRMKKIMAVALAAVMASFSLSACGGGNKAPTSGETTKKSKAQDTIIYAQGADPRGLDPALIDDGESGKVIVNIYEGL